MSVCSCCLHRIKHRNVIEVGHWWNNSPDLAVVCSEDCKDKLWKMLQDKTWMIHRPVKMFPNKKVSGPSSLTDKQFKTEI